MPAAVGSHYSAPALVSIVSIVTNVTFVSLRTWARRLQKSKWMWADVFVPISLAINLAQASLIIHLYLAFERKGGGLKGPLVIRAFVLPLLNGLAITMPKLAVINVYFYIFQKSWAKWVLLMTASIVTAAGTAVIFGTIFQCRPVQFTWDHSVVGGRCSDLKALFNYAFIPNVVTDVVLLVVPIPIISGLQMSWSVKAGVLATFLSGGIGVAAASIRLYTFFQWTPRKGDADTIRVASNIEITAYLTVACLLQMRPLFNHLLSKKPLKLLTSPWSSRYYAKSTAPALSLTTLDRRSRRRRSQSTNSSAGELIRTCEEGGSSIHVLREVKVDVRSNSTAAVVPKPSATSISSDQESRKADAMVWKTWAWSHS